MKILLIGGLGSIGSRYRAIFRFLNVQYEVYNVPEAPISVDAINSIKFDRALICSPTNTHAAWCETLSLLGKPFLVEKPLATNVVDAKKVANLAREMPGQCFMVNNYNFLKTFQLQKSTLKSIVYNFYNTGGDGLVWDVCQLLYIAQKNGMTLEVFTNSPRWTLSLDKVDVPYREMEDSYIKMIQAWMNNSTINLWDLDEAVDVTTYAWEILSKTGNDPLKSLKIDSVNGTVFSERRDRNESTYWDAGQKRLEEIAEQNLREDRTRATS